MHHVSVEERLDDGVAEEEPFAPVSLPASAPRSQLSAAGASGRHSRPLPPPGGARRIQVPVPPPRPEHTLTAGSRPLPPPPSLSLPSSQAQTASAASKNASSPQAAGPQQPGLQPTVPISPNSLSSSLLPASHWSGVTLTQPRPEPDREKNLYTEAPKKLPQQIISDLPIGLSATKQQHTSTFSAASSESSSVNSQLSSISVIPTSNNKLKNHENGSDKLDNNLENGSGGSEFLSSSRNSSRQEESIFCQRCGKCKCEACVRPRKLPEKWLCGGTLLCSKKTVVDGLSCMCCVRGLFYHCTKDSQRGEIDPNKEPCSCTGNQAAARWGIMLPLLPLIPCLIAYPLWGACAKMTESVYAKCTASGCQCQNSTLTSEVTSIASEPSLIAVESQPLPSLLITPEKKQLLSGSPLKPKLASLWIHSDTIQYIYDIIIQISSTPGLDYFNNNVLWDQVFPKSHLSLLSILLLRYLCLIQSK